ncbi:unnamed product [Ostreococcus tauri]|uniref:Unnamed product n=1 Tax=Ostreococcus tauri TaxID=70448 RepID=A0A090M768_OSTTA|nr:unnamed product [Ostreococcus tauri]CEG00888.1 unnamed product [Ostreococcus tauri]|eukprot:XP_022840651.1 unnamed product [Ostreococcus tauri]
MCARTSHGTSATVRARTSPARARARRATRACATRREVVDGVVAVAASALASELAGVSPALALLQPNDEEDEAFLAKARENRAKRIQSEVQKEKRYVNDAGLKLDENASKVQVAVYKLSKSGAAIARGDLGGASSELAAGGDWASQATSAAEALGAGESRARFEKSVAELARRCDGGDESAAKAAFVASSRALKELAEEAKVVDKLRLL